jgi:transketolase
MIKVVSKPFNKEMPEVVVATATSSPKCSEEAAVEVDNEVHNKEKVCNIPSRLLSKKSIRERPQKLQWIETESVKIATVKVDKAELMQPAQDAKEEEWELKWPCLVQECTLNQLVHALIAMELELKFQRKTSARIAQEEKLSRRRRFLNALLRKVLQMARNTSSMESLINIQIKKQDML